MQLSQKYRPNKLSDIAGHKHAIKELTNRVATKNIPQAIYITGESGQGKTTLARIIAQTINCETGGNDPCGKCESCLSVVNETFHREIKELNASNLDTEKMRELEEDSSMRSFFGEKKVWIINEFQELSNNPKARKNILALLENKNDNVHVIITSMDDSKTDAAIKNRCVCFNLKPLQPEEMGTYLIGVCEKEGIKVSEKEIDVLVVVAQNSNGSVRQALSYLDRIIHGELWDAETAITELGITSQDTLLRMVGDILSGKPEALSVYPPKESLEKVKWMLLNCIKAKLSVVNEYERKQLGKLPDLFPVERFKFVLDGLMSLYGMPYIDSFAIQNWVLNCVMNVSEWDRQTARGPLKENTEDKPVRGRGR